MRGQGPCRRLARASPGARLRSARSWRRRSGAGHVREPDRAELPTLFHQLGEPGGPDRPTAAPSPPPGGAARAVRARRPRCGGPARWARRPTSSWHRIGRCCWRPMRPYAPARYSTPELLATERELLQGALERPARGRRAGGRAARSTRCSPPVLSCRTSRRRWCAASPRAATACRSCWGERARARPTPCSRRARSGRPPGYRGDRRGAGRAGGFGARGGVGDTIAHAGAGAPRRAAILERSPLHAMSVVSGQRGRHGGNARPRRAGAPRRREPAPSWCWWETTPSCPRSPPGEPSARWRQTLAALELSQNRRQERGWEREALVAIREGRAQRCPRRPSPTGASTSPPAPPPPRGARHGRRLAGGPPRRAQEALMIAAAP